MAGKAKGKLLALDWDSRTLRIVYASVSKRGAMIERVLSVNIPPDVDNNDPAQMGLHIRRALDAENISVKHALVDIPRDQAILNTLRLPAISMDEMPGVVQIQIAKELPFPVTEAAIDFAVESRDESEGDGKVDVLVAAVRKDDLARYTQTFEVAGLKLDRVGLRPYAGKVAVSQLLKHALPDRVLYLDIRPTLTEINVMRSGGLAFSRAASVLIPEFPQDGGAPTLKFETESETVAPEATGIVEPGQDSTVESCVRALLMEVMRSMEAYRGKDPGGAIDHVVVGGDLGVEEKLVEVIQDRLDVTAEIYNPASTFGWEPDEGAEAASFAASLGLVLGHADDGQLHFDFLHPKRVVTVTEKRLKKAPMIAAVVVLFLVAGVAFGLQVTKQDRQKRDRLQDEIEQFKQNEKDNKQLRKFMDEVYAFEDQLVWVDVLNDVLMLMPSHQELVVESIECDQGNRLVKIRTISKQSDTALNAEEKLEEFRREGKKLPRFDVRLGTQSQNAGDLYPYNQEFRITVLDDEPRKKGARRQGR